MISLKFKTEFPIRFQIKKYGIVWQRIGLCCGLTHYLPKKWLLIRFAISDSYFWRCPQCGRIHGLKLMQHTIPFHTKEMREQNNLLGDKK